MRFLAGARVTSPLPYDTAVRAIGTAAIAPTAGGARRHGGSPHRLVLTPEERVVQQETKRLRRAPRKRTGESTTDE
jgi:hypothetical protein